MVRRLLCRAEIMRQFRAGLAVVTQKWHFLSIFGLFIVLLVLFCTAGHTAETNSFLAPESSISGNKLLTKEGTVQVNKKGAWEPALANQSLTAGDRVRTGERSRATIRLSDLSILRVNELTTLEIRPQDGDKRSTFELKSGAGYFFNRDKP